MFKYRFLGLIYYAIPYFFLVPQLNHTTLIIPRNLNFFIV